RSLDEAGRELLDLWSRHGARFIARSERPRPSLDWVMERSFRLFLRAAPIPLAFLISLLLPSGVFAADELVPAPAVVLARYNVYTEQNKMRGREVLVDIEASLPKLSKKGRLRAIRRSGPFRRPEYEVLRVEGDRTVRQQVIARYLTADAQAQAMTSSSVTVSEANYRFHFIGAI